MPLSKYHPNRRIHADCSQPNAFMTQVKRTIKPSLLSLAVAQALVAHASDAATIVVKGNCGLSQAIISANKDISFPGSNCEPGSGADTIELNRNVVVKKRFGSSDSGMPVISSEMTINGNGHSIRRDDNAPAVRLLHINTNQNVTLNHLELSNGLLQNQQSGAGLYITDVGRLTLNRVELLDNSTNGHGGGLCINDVNNIITLKDSRISRNSASIGGGISIDDDYSNFGSNANIIIEASTISENSAHKGAGIFLVNSGSGYYLYGPPNLKVNASSILDNSATLAGGGLYTEAYNNEIINSTISGNVASIGGGIFVRRPPGGITNSFPLDREANNLTISASTLNANSALGGNGGGIYTSEYTGTSISESFIFDNEAAQSGGGLAVGAAYNFVDDVREILIHNSSFSNNKAVGYGGAIFTPSTADGVQVEGSALEGNHSDLGGGAIFISPSLASGSGLNVVSSSISDNSTNGDGGAILALDQQGYYCNIYSYYCGPAYDHESGTGVNVNILNSTVSGNSASQNGGGVQLKQTFNSSNSPQFLSVETSQLALVNSTFSNNVATKGGGIASGNASLNLTDSIISGNDAAEMGSEIARDPLANAEVVSSNNVLGSSFINNYQAVVNFLPSDTDIVATIDGSFPTPLLSIVEPLQNNGGSTLTHALPANSPAVNAGDINSCLSKDQLGKPRSITSLCDIGAFESEFTQGSFASINIPRLTVSEAIGALNKRAVVEVSLSQSLAIPVSVDFATVDQSAVDGDDYIARSGTIHFLPGEIKKTRSIDIIDDDLIEGFESFGFKLSNPVGANLQIKNAVAGVGILDNDDSSKLPLVSISSENRRLEVKEGDKRHVAIRIILANHSAAEPVSVDFATVSGTAKQGTDFVARAERIDFKLGQTSATRYIEILNDMQSEPDEELEFVLTSPENAVLSSTTAKIKILDANRPLITVNNSRVDESDSKARVDILLSEPQDYRVFVSFGTHRGDALASEDFISRGGRIMFEKGQTVATRYIDIVNDNQPEEDEFFYFSLSNPENAKVVNGQARIEIIDND